MAEEKWEVVEDSPTSIPTQDEGTWEVVSSKPPTLKERRAAAKQADVMQRQARLMEAGGMMPMLDQPVEQPVAAQVPTKDVLTQRLANREEEIQGEGWGDPNAIPASSGTSTFGQKFLTDVEKDLSQRHIIGPFVRGSRAVADAYPKDGIGPVDVLTGVGQTALDMLSIPVTVASGVAGIKQVEDPTTGRVKVEDRDRVLQEVQGISRGTPGASGDEKAKWVADLFMTPFGGIFENIGEAWNNVNKYAPFEHMTPSEKYLTGEIINLVAGGKIMHKMGTGMKDIAISPKTLADKIAKSHMDIANEARVQRATERAQTSVDPVETAKAAIELETAVKAKESGGTIAEPVAKGAAGAAWMSQRRRGEEALKRAAEGEKVEPGEEVEAPPVEEVTTGKPVEPGAPAEMGEQKVATKALTPRDVSDFVQSLRDEYTEDIDASAQTSSKSNKITSIRFNRLRVPEEDRGQGIGTSVLDAMKAFADERGVRVEVSVNIQEPGLVDFYKARGFVQDSRPWKKGEGNLVYKPTSKRKLSSRIEDSGTTEAAAAEPAKVDYTIVPGSPVRIRKTYAVVESINPDGTLQLVGREKPIKMNRHVKVVGEPVDLELHKQNRAALVSAGYSDSAISKMSPDESHAILTGISDELAKRPSADALAKMQAVHEAAIESRRAASIEEINLLKANGYSDSWIANASERSIRDKAAEIRDGVKLKASEKAQATKDNFEQVWEEMGNRPIDELTPEELERLTAALKDVGDYQSEVVDDIMLRDQEQIAALEALEEGDVDAYLDKQTIAKDSMAVDDAISLGDVPAAKMKAERFLHMEDAWAQMSAAERKHFLEELANSYLSGKGAARAKEKEVRTIIRRREGGEEVRITKVDEFTKEMTAAREEVEAAEEKRGPRGRSRGKVTQEEVEEWNKKLEGEGLGMDEGGELIFDVTDKVLGQISLKQIKQLNDAQHPINYLDNFGRFMLATKVDRKVVYDWLEGLEKRAEAKGDKKGVADAQMLYRFYDSSVKFDDAWDRTRSRLSYTSDMAEARTLTTRAHNYLPSRLPTRFSKDKFLGMIRDIEDHAGQYDIVHRRGGDPRIAIQTAKDHGHLTPEQADWMYAVVDGLKERANFDLVFPDDVKGELASIADMDKRSIAKMQERGSVGYYNFATNLMAIKDPSYFVHEVGHFAFGNILRGKDRVKFTKSLVDEFYRAEDGRLDRVKLAKSLNSDNINEMMSPMEIFSREFQNYVADRAGRPEHELLYKKAETFMTNLLSSILGSKNIPYDRKAIYERVLSDIVNHKTTGGLRPGVRRKIVQPRVQIDDRDAVVNDAIFVKQGGANIIERYLNKFIGSGEGGAAYGWGHYFSSAREVAEHYARNVYAKTVRKFVGDGSSAQLLYNDIPFGQSFQNLTKVAVDKLLDARSQRRVDKFGEAMLFAKEELKTSADIIERELAKIKEKWNRTTVRDTSDNDYVEFGRRALVDIRSEMQKLESIKMHDLSVSQQHGYKKVVHDVELPDDIVLLDLDRPLFPNIKQQLVDGLEKLQSRKTWGDWLPKNTDNYLPPGMRKKKSEFLKGLLDDLASDESQKVWGKTLAEEVRNPYDGDMLLAKGAPIDETTIWKLKDVSIASVYIEGENGPVRVNVPTTGKDIQKQLQRLFGVKGASKFMYKHCGIDGNTYIGDRWATKDQQGARNYVIFDESIPQIQGHVTLNMLGFQSLYEGMEKMIQRMRKKEANVIESVGQELGSNQDHIDRIREGLPPKKKDILDEEGGLLGTEEIEETPPPDVRDLGHARNWVRQPLGSPTLPGREKKWLEKHVSGWADGTPVEPIVYRVNLAEQESNFHHANNIIGLRDIQMFLSKNHITGEELTKYMREGGTDEYVTRNLGGKDTQVHAVGLNEAAAKVRDWLDYMRDRYKDFLKEQYARHLTQKDAADLYKVLNGTPVDQIKGRKNKALLEEIMKEWKEIDNWGIDDYLPKVEFGTYRILNEERNVVGVAVSRHHAVEKAIDYMEQHPDYGGNFYIDNSPKSSLNTHLYGLKSSKQYHSIVNRLKRSLDEEAKGILDIAKTLPDMTDEAIEKITNEKDKARAMAQRAVKRTFSVTPTDVWSEFAEKRHDKLRGEENIFPVLARYSRIMEKKMALDPVIHDYKKDVRPFLAGSKDYKTGKYGAPNLIERTDNLLQDVKGRYWELDKWIDNMLTPIYNIAEKSGMDVGPPPLMTASKFLGRAREFEANVKLGYRPINAAVNWASGQGHVWSKTGVKHIVKAYEMRGTPEGKALLEELGPYLGMTFADEGIFDPSKAGVFSTRRAGESAAWTYGKPLGLFQAAEVPNRQIGILANYYMAKDAFGMSDAAAKETAIRANWFQNFTYNVANMPGMWRGPIARTIMQFKPYLFKELEFISSLRAPELMRYMTMQMSLGGPRAAMYVLKSLPFVAYAAGFGDIERWVNTWGPRATRAVVNKIPGLENVKNVDITRGIPGMLGADISSMAAFQLPSDLKDLAGASISDAFTIIKNTVAAPWMGEKSWQEVATPENFRTIVSDVWPAFRNMLSVWDNVLMSKDGQMRNPETGMPMSDEPIWLDTDQWYKKVWEASQYAGKRMVGAQDLRYSVNQVEDWLDKDLERRLTNASRNIDHLIALRKQKTDDIPQWMMDRKQHLMELGKDLKLVGMVDAITQQYLPPTVRRMRRKSLMQKIDAVEHAPQLD